MPEGLSASEVGKGVVEHAAGHHTAKERRDIAISITEAILLSLVTLAAAWSGFAAAKWGTESSVSLATANTERAKSNRASLQAQALRNFDASTFNAWFSAYSARNEVAMKVAEHRFRPEFAVAFDAWRKTRPETNPNAPRGPTYMPQYRQPLIAQAAVLEAHATTAFAEGEEFGATSDKYVRTTVILASILFLVGISAHFPLRGVRYGLVALGGVLLVISVVELANLPRPPL